MIRLLMILSLAVFSIAGCQSTTVSGCPPLIKYNSLTQKQVAEELRKLPKGSPLAQMVIDYKKTRDALRVCN